MSWDTEMAALNPSSWWKFAGNGNDSAGAANLTEQGTPTYVASLVPSQGGAASSAVELDGISDYFTGGDVYDLNVTFADLRLSIAFWIKIESANFSSGFQVIISKRSSDAGFPGWMLHGGGTGDLFLHFDDATTEEGWQADLSLGNGSEHFIVITFDGSLPKLICYVDGSEATSDVTFTNQTAPADTTANLEVGAARGGNSKFQGILDELALWDGHVLTASDVTTLWNAATETLAADLRLRGPVTSGQRW